MKLFVQIPLIALALLSSAAAFAQTKTVFIFASAQHPVMIGQVRKDFNVEYFDANQLKTILSQMNSSIAGESQKEAKNHAKALMRQFQSKLEHASQGAVLRHRFKITQIPTIVFSNGSYQVIGQDNLSVAIEEFRKWKVKHGG